MEEEPWDELMGGSPDEDAVRQTVLRLQHEGGGGSPPEGGRNAAAVTPDHQHQHYHESSRWSQVDPPTEEESREATRRAAAMMMMRNSYDEYDPSGGPGDRVDDDEAGRLLSAPYKQRRSTSLPIEDELDDYDRDDADADEENSSATGDYLSANDAGSSAASTEGGTIDHHHHHYQSDEQQSALKIRQEALKVLEVADDQLNSSSYSVYRTVSGGFMASAEPIESAAYGRGGGHKKRIPSALSGLTAVAAASRRHSSPYSDADPYATNGDAHHHHHQHAGQGGSNGGRQTYYDYDDGCEYGDEDAVLDAMERRAASTRSASESAGSKWSSRYSVDKTLLALSGGATAATAAMSRGKFLDQLDRDHRKLARDNLFRNAPSKARNASVFGGAASSDFRQNFVFGKQGVTVEQTSNLREAFTTGGGSLPPASPAKSWQSQAAAKVRRRRRLMVAAAAVAFVLFVAMAGALGQRKRQASSAAALGASTGDAGGAQADLTFYVTSNVPYTYQEEQALVDHLETLDKGAKFLAHLGNIQEAATTLCQPVRYENVALLLRNSPVTTFMLPGEEDWANCPNPDQAWENWSTNFAYFEDAFGHHPDTKVGRQIGRLENFAFVESGVLILGVHVIVGKMEDEDATIRRNADNLDWVRYMTSDLGKKARAVVVMGNAKPSGLPPNDEFFKGMSEFLHAYGKPAMYVHANSGVGGLQEYKPFGDKAEGVIAVQVSPGGKNPPVKITVKSGNAPFSVSA